LAPSRPWVPSGRELPGLALALALGFAAYVLGRSLGDSVFISDVILAIFLGALVLNTPLAERIGLGEPEARDTDRYERGLRFTGKWVLRLAIILMGLKVRTDLFRVDQVLIVVSIILFALPTAFFLTHSAARWLGLRQELGDLLSIGTMICGASAINALSPVIYARRRDQGLAITAVFLFSVVALLVFYPVAQALGLSEEFSGLWAGLAVNDLSGAVAVGSQFSGSAEVIAAASKSVRIMLLGPILILFTVLRPTTRGEDPDLEQNKWIAHFPKFILGYFLFFGFRVLGDATFGDATGWESLLVWNGFAVKMLVLGVCAGIGLQIRVSTLIEVGWKAALVGACASLGMAGLSLGMLLGYAREMPAMALALGAAGLLVSFGLYRFKSSAEAAVFQRLEEGAPLSMREAISVFDALDRRDALDGDICAKVLGQLYPAIGELQPLRTAELVPPIHYRRLIYWKSERGSGSLVGILWAPGAEAHIHTHGFEGLGKTIEGRIEESTFERIEGGKLRMVARENVDPEEIRTLCAHETLHAIRNIWEKDAIHVHFYGPEHGAPGVRYDPEGAEPLGSLQVGDEFAARESEDVLPQSLVGSLGAAAAR